MANVGATSRKRSSTSGLPTSPTWMMRSQPRSAATACGRSRPWVSEMTPSSLLMGEILSLRERVDLFVGRKAAGALLGELELPVDQNLEHAPARGRIGDLGAGKLLEPRSRTESARLIVSLHAVFDDDLH